MKQYITWEQFVELSFEQVKILQKLIDQRYHLVRDAEQWEEIKNHKYVTSEGEVFHIHTSYIGFMSKTNIGKMIEILESKDQCLNIIKRTDLDGWGYDIHLRQIHYYSFSTGELCDALWEAVKEVLKG